MSDKPFNLFALDDPLFPTFTPQAKVGDKGGVLESDNGGVFEADAVDTMAGSQIRSMAMAAVLSWVEDGNFSFLALDEYVLGVADLDGDYEIAGDEEDLYNEVWANVPDAMLSLGASVEDVTALADGENDEAGSRVGAALAAFLEGAESSDDELISAFATTEDAVMESCVAGQDAVFEAAYKKMKMVRGGKVVIARKRISGKVRLSATQKAGLKKARLKSNNAAARLSRKKSLRVRKQRGM